MKKVFLITFIFSTIFCAIGKSEAAPSLTPPWFNLEPTAAGSYVVWQGVNAGKDTGVITPGDHYGRNIFWDFSTNPNGSGAKATNYYGVVDSTYKTSDSATVSSSLWSTGSTKLAAASGATGTATFNLANPHPLDGKNWGPQYFWLEMDLDLRKSASVTLSLSGTGATLASTNGVWANQGGTINNNIITWAFGTPSGSGYKTVNAWFKFDQFPSSASFVLNFNGSDGYAYVDNLQVAATPEPIAASLFVAGSAIMAMRRRRKAQAAGLAIA